MPTKSYRYITTPIYYVNDVPHIGTAYTSIATDVWARFMRMDGYDVKFLTGTDEHGQKIEKSAHLAGMEPQAFVDKQQKPFRDVLELFDIKPNDFIRTTEERHKKAAKYFWNVLQEKGYIYLGLYAGWYSVRDEAFYTADEVVDGKAPTGAPVEWVEESTYFFKLSAFQEPLLKFYKENPDFVLPKSRFNEVIRFVEGGLKDLAVSRTTFKWGIPVPNSESHIMYVWLDALTNYISALGYPEAGEMKEYWPAATHIIGKDILRFHAVYWPAFLMAAGLTPPKHIIAHGWWTNGGQKISKSLGNVINPFELVGRFGSDPVRFFLLREVPFGQDGDFSEEALIRRLNTDLANDFGNLAQRTLSFIHKNAGASVPEPSTFSDADNDMLQKTYALLPILREHIENFAFHKALEAIFDIVGSANRYIDEQAPWILRKTDITRMNTVLYVLLEVLRHLGIYLNPFIPVATQKLLETLGVDFEKTSLASVGEKETLKPGTALKTPIPLFPRYVQE
jgi:methionyl-tRNA synthetase